MTSGDPHKLIDLVLQGDGFGDVRIALRVDYVDGLWVYHNEQLNLWGYAERREDAIRDLNENFVFLWREYAEEKDDVLDEAALELKQRLLALRNQDATRAG